MPEGRLTAARASLVNRDALARVATRLSLGDFLLLGQGEEATGGRDRPSNLAGALEALMGALLLDRGTDEARELALGLMGPGLDRVAREGVVPDAKSQIQELVQRSGGMRPTYRVVREAGPDHAKHFLSRRWWATAWSARAQVIARSTPSSPPLGTPFAGWSRPTVRRGTSSRRP